MNVYKIYSPENKAFSKGKMASQRYDRYSKFGKIWVKQHFHSHLSMCGWDDRYNDDDVIIEYSLVEVNRYNLKEYCETNGIKKESAY
jgi:hypothetical protein